MAKTRTSTKESSTVKEKKATGTGSKKPTVKKTTTKKSTAKKTKTTKTSTKKTAEVEEVEEVKEEETYAEAAAKRLAKKEAAVSKAKKTKPTDFKDFAISIADIVSNAYNLTKPKDKDISVSEIEKVALNRIPISLQANWGKHCHEYQVKMFIDCLAHKMQYEVRNFQLRPDVVLFELYGPFPDIKTEE